MLIPVGSHTYSRASDTGERAGLGLPPGGANNFVEAGRDADSHRLQACATTDGCGCEKTCFCKQKHGTPPLRI
ncbi:MAG: hypothetical protein K8S55_12720 [Phycisphaerae bacterium]|nr:hypothetical protein [Phycisphaerae bacterium]